MNIINKPSNPNPFRFKRELSKLKPIFLRFIPETKNNKYESI